MTLLVSKSEGENDYPVKIKKNPISFEFVPDTFQSNYPWLFTARQRVVVFILFYECIKGNDVLKKKADGFGT